MDESEKKLYACGWCKEKLLEENIKTHGCLDSYPRFVLQENIFYPADADGMTCFLNSKNHCNYSVTNEEILQEFERNSIINEKETDNQNKLSQNEKVCQRGDANQDGKSSQRKLEAEIISNTHVQSSVSKSNKKKGKNSEVWKYFTKNSNGTLADCNLCNRTVKCAGNTTNLHSHLQHKHCDISINENKTKKRHFNDSTNSQDEQPKAKKFHVSQSDNRNQAKIDTLLRNQQAYEDGGTKAAEITRKLIYMIAKDKMPYNIVEKEGFRTFVQQVAPLYTLPNRNKVTSLLSEKYIALRNLVKQKFDTIADLSLTVDIWTDSNKTKSYLGMTSHFIEELKFKSIVIGVLPLDDHHTSINIKFWIEKMIQSWNIKKEQVSAVVSDNAANVKKAVTECFGEEKYLNCFAHTLNLVPANIMEKNKIVSPIISKVKNIVSYFKSSCVASDELRKSTNLVLIQSNNTRWNAIFLMLKRYIVLSDIVTSILVRSVSKNVPAPLMGEEIVTAKEIMYLLDPFYEATKIVSGENYLTGSQAMPLIKNLKRCLENIETSSTTSQNLKIALIEEFVKRFKNIEHLFNISAASLLDPRFKKMYFEEPLACSKVVSKICECLKSKNNSSQSIEKTASKENVPISVNEKSYSVIDQPINIWMLDEKLRSQQIKESNTKPEESSELKYYLSQPPISKGDDPIAYWLKRPQTPLSKLALRFLTVIATSVPSERLFSQASLILTDKRNQLSEEHFQEVLFLSSLHKDDWKLN